MTTELCYTVPTAAFGDVCLQRDAGPDGAAPKPWSAYYLRRVSHVAARPPLSPLDLVQERHARNAFTLLASVQLCSRTSGGALVRGVIDAFMELYPTPQSVLSADAAALRALLLPLGLNRERTLARFALEFATKPWRDPSELHGCGKLAADSWRIFCLGQLSRCARDAQADPALRAYCRAMASYDEEGAGSATAAAAPAAAARRKRAGGGGSGGARKRGSSVKRGGAEGSAPMGRRSPRLVSAAGGPLATADVAVTGKARGGQKRSRH
ncbi:hypothetical protein JKP88DRAFT_302431 [Tribonema minus]|uniref:HhH-GPD domain-containing protein n=1 Tax=Tribonema minus TaxID=303371 RepID=A0A835ZF17_9STRA|nr:hypothetical protein JKP88DRAFT_302431 [Tribonema minus]